MPRILHRYDQHVRLDADRHGRVAARRGLGYQADGVGVDLYVVLYEVEAELHGEAASQHVGADLARLDQRVLEPATACPLLVEGLVDVALGHVTEIDEYLAERLDAAQLDLLFQRPAQLLTLEPAALQQRLTQPALIVGVHQVDTLEHRRFWRCHERDRALDYRLDVRHAARVGDGDDDAAVFHLVRHGRELHCVEPQQMLRQFLGYRFV